MLKAKPWKIAAVALVLLAFFGLDASLHAQSVQSSIVGTVTDKTGAFVAGAKITVTSEEEGRTVTLQSGGSGAYQVLNLQPAHYRVEVERAGFEAAVKENVSLTARQELRLDFVLQPGAVSEQVMVNASDEGAITTDTPSISASLDSEDVMNLPANYRGAGSTSPYNVLQTLPGVQPDSTGFPPSPGINGTSGGPAINFSIQGGLPSQSDITIDGISAQNPLSNSPFPDAFPSAETISEIRVDGVLNNAEFGQPGEITTVTKSGTNRVRGSLFWYFQNSGLDATPYGSLSKPKKVGNDFGASAGGPVVIPKLYSGKDKTFFFGTYEGFRYPQSRTVQYLVPTALMKQGNFNNEFTGSTPQLANPFVPGSFYSNNTLPSINPGASPFLALFPDPNFGNLTSVAGAEATTGINFIQNRPDSYQSNQFDARLDHYFGQKASVMARYTWKSIALDSPNVLNIPENTNYDKYSILVASFNYSFRPNLINEFRFGFTLDKDGTDNPLKGASITNAAGLDGIGPSFPFNGITELDFNQLTSEQADHLTIDSKSSLYQYADDISWTKGGHSAKFGFDIKRLQAFPPTSFYGADNYGNFHFDGSFTNQEFADFLLGLSYQSEVDNLTGQFQGGSMAYAVFAQDNWKVTPNFNLVYGLRHELHPPYHDPTGNIGNFDPSVPLSGRVVYPDGHANILAPGYLADFNACPVAGVNNPYATGQPANGAPCTPVVTNSQAGLPGGLRKYPKLRFAPRLGFAWRPFGNDQTSVRGGFGYYNISLLGSGYYSLTATLQADTRVFNNLETATGPAYQWPNTNGGSTGLSAPQFGTAYFGTGALINWKDPYSLQWDLSVDHEFSHGIGARLSYIALKSDQLVWEPNENDLPYSTTMPATSQPLSARPFPNWGTINNNATGANARYESLQGELSRRFSNGIEFNSAFTYAKNITDNQGTDQNGSFASENGGNRATSEYDRSQDYGNVYGTRKLRWSNTAVYDIPVGRGRQFGSGMNRLEDAAIGGWRLSNIFLVQTGPWLTPYIPGGNADPSGSGSGTLFGRDQHPDRLASGIPAHRSRNSWIDPTAFVCPGYPDWTPGTACTTGSGSGPSPNPIGRYGTSHVGVIPGPGTVNLSSGLSKVFSVTESVKLRAEGTFTNVLNHANLADPILDITNPGFGKITSVRGSDFGGSRTGQVSMRLEF